MELEKIQEVIQKWFEKNNLENRKITAEMQKPEPNTNLVCPVCKQKGNEFTRQTRSGDEAATVFFKCINFECKEFMIEKRIEMVRAKQPGKK